MKIAVSSTGNTLDSQIDRRFGRASYFIIVDSETMNFEVLDNGNLAAAGGAGISSAKAVIDAGAEAVITGNCGPNAQRILSAAEIKLFTGVSGTVKEAIELYTKGQLKESAESNVGTHFGMNNSNG